MLINAPIFLNCFSRGGSNILWNLFLTHPDVCSPIIETLQIFRAGLRKPRREGYQVVLISRQWNLFNQWNLEERSANKATQQYIDRTLYTWKLKTVKDEEMRFRAEDQLYTLDEVKAARLVAKNNNGLTFMSTLLMEMYPDATFFALVRHPVALYESHKRRKIHKSLEDFATYYRAMVTRMLEDEARYERYHLVRFEDVLQNTVETMRRLYDLAGLDFAKVDKVRFKAKPHLTEEGKHTTAYEEGRHYWFDFEDIQGFLDPNVNMHQRSQLGDVERVRVLELTQDLLPRVGYTDAVIL